MAMVKTCLDCGTNIEHRLSNAKRCVSCAKKNRVRTRKDSDARYSRRGHRVKASMLKESNRICLVCDERVRHYKEFIHDARICYVCRQETLEDMGDVEGIPKYGAAHRNDISKTGRVTDFRRQIRYQEG